MRPKERDDVLLGMASDIAYIKAKIEVLPDYERRLRSLEKWRWAIPGSLIAALLTFLQ
jgi:hypothetical protein